MQRLQDQVVLITGGSSGIGLATARLFTEQGARVYLLGRDQNRLREAAATVKGDVHSLCADLSRPSEVQAAFAKLSQHEKKLDCLLNCAGQLEIGSAEALGAEVAERLIQINYLGAVRCIEAALPLLKAGTRRSIVNVSSIAGRMAPPYMAAYSASKFALNGYTQALRQELREENFHIALLCPGPVATPMTADRLHTQHYRLPPGIPVLPPERVAKALLRLVDQRKNELTLPRRLQFSGRLVSAFPGLVDHLYRWVYAKTHKDGRKPASTDA